MLLETRTRVGIAALVYMMANAVLFGAGVTAVLAIPALQADAAIWIPIVVIASMTMAAPIAWAVAPRLRARYRRQRI